MTPSDSVRAPAPEFAGSGGPPVTASRLAGVFWIWGAAVAGGLILTLGYAPWNQAWAAWIGLTPLIAAVWFQPQDRRRGWRGALLGYVAGLAFFLPVFKWLISVTFLGWFLLQFYMALYFAFWGWFMAVVARPVDVTPGTVVRGGILSSRHNLAVAFLGAGAWVFHEWARGVVFTGFGWNGLGVILHRELPFIQIAELTGVGGISFLLAFCNIMIVLSIWRLVREVGRVRLRPHYDYGLTMVMVVGVFTFGVRALQEPETGATLKVAAVQPNIPQNEKWDPAFDDRIHERLRSLTQTATAVAPHLILWPEAATPRGMFGDAASFRFVQEMAGAGHYGLLLGTLDFDENGDYNVAVFLEGAETAPQIYRKIHLVPFGEFIPFRRSFPLFAAIVGDLVPGDFRAGNEPVILRLDQPPLRIGPLICFEDTVGRLTRRFVGNGADLMVNITNDGWFLRTEGAEQHLANSVFRTVENRRPLLRCANTGVTAFIDTRGRVRQSLRDADGSHFMQGVLFGSVAVPTDARRTFYTRHGEVFSGVMVVVTICAVGVSAWRRRKVA